MRATRSILVALALAAGGAAGAPPGHDHAARRGTLTGEVVDITCLMDHASSGERHAGCAQKCIAKGLPVGLLVGDRLYAVIVSTHESPNDKLAAFAGQLVTMTGTIVEKDGMRAIDMESVAPAATR